MVFLLKGEWCICANITTPVFIIVMKFGIPLGNGRYIFNVNCDIPLIAILVVKEG